MSIYGNKSVPLNSLNQGDTWLDINEIYMVTKKNREYKGKIKIECINLKDGTTCLFPPDYKALKVKINLIVNKFFDEKSAD